VEGDAAREGLGAPPRELGRGAAEQQEAAPRLRPVREHAQDREELGAALHLVEHDQTLEPLEGEHRLPEPGEVGRRLEVEALDRPLLHRRELPRQGRLSHLSRAEERHDRVAREQPAEGRDVTCPGDLHGRIVDRRRTNFKELTLYFLKNAY
jgi:hypothetical protein